MTEIKEPLRIEEESFKIIRSEIGEHNFSEEQLIIAIRVIHATADFDFRDILRFHPMAVESGVNALRRGALVLTDVHMVEAGISQRYLDILGSKKVCDISHPDVKLAAEKANETRSAMAMRRNVDLLDGGIVAIGNAPTALMEVIRLVQDEEIDPALIIGVPVGFVNTVESKQALCELDVPFITCPGRKGGSSVAVAAVNALMRLAVRDV